MGSYSAECLRENSQKGRYHRFRNQLYFTVTCDEFVLLVRGALVGKPAGSHTSIGISELAKPAATWLAQLALFWAVCDRFWLRRSRRRRVPARRNRAAARISGHAQRRRAHVITGLPADAFGI